MKKTILFPIGFAAFLTPPLSILADTYAWDGGAASASWGSANNWNPDGVPTFDNTTEITFNNAGAGNLSNFTGSARTLRSLTFTDDADADITIRTTTTAAGTTAANLTFEADAGNAFLTVNSGAAASLITVGTAGGNLVLNSTLEIAHHGAGELLLGRPVSGAGGIIKTGAGTLRFNQQSNSFTGNIVINGGTLIDNGGTAGSALGTGPKTITLGGGTLLFERNYGANSVMGDKSFITTAATSSVIRYNEQNAATRNFTISGATESATLNGNLLVDNISASGGADVIVWNLTTTGGGLFSYSGANDDVLNNLNDLRFQVSGDLSGHNGGIEVRKGTWLANGANALGAGAIHLGVADSADSAAISLNASSATTIANALNVRSGAGTRLIDNTNASGVDRNWDGVLTLDGTLTYRSNFNDDFTSSSTLTGSGGLVKLGTGQLDLRGSNGGYSGNITVSEGELRVVQASMGSGAVSIASGANLNLQRTSGSVLYSNNISGAGTMTVGGGNLIALSGANTSSGDITVAGSGTVLRIDNTAFNSSTANIAVSGATGLLRLNATAEDQTIGNLISGAGSMVKQGSMTTVLTAANTYAGTTSVSAGTLIVNGNQSAATGIVTVDSGATLGGVGSVGGATTFASGATLSPGASAGDISQTLDFASLTLEAGSFWLVDLVNAVTNDSDLVTVNNSGGLSISGALTINEVSGTFTPNTTYRIASYTGGLGGAGLFSNDSGGFISNGTNTWSINYNDGGFITLTAVPEPGTIGLLGLGLGGLVVRRLRRKRNESGAIVRKCHSPSLG